MMIYAQIVSMLVARQLKQLAAQLEQEGARLGASSTSHPIMELLTQVQRAARLEAAAAHGQGARSPEGWANLQNDVAELANLRHDAAAVLQAMLRLPAKQRLNPNFEVDASQVAALSSNDVGRIAFGTETGENAAASSLLENIAALGWSEGFKVLLAESPPFESGLIGAAIIKAGRNQHPEMVNLLLDMHAEQHPGKLLTHGISHQGAAVLLRMENVTGAFLARALEFFEADTIGEALLEGQDDYRMPKNVINWIEADPAAWTKAHDQLRQEFERNVMRGDGRAGKSVAVPSAWPLLLRGVLASKQGLGHPALATALADPSADWWLQAPTWTLANKGDALGVASALIQGNLIGEQYRETKLSIGELRQRVRLIQTLHQHGATVRAGDWQLGPIMSARSHEYSELGHLASKGKVLTRAFLHRHPEWANPTPTNGRNALFFANNVETFEKLVSVGLDPTARDKHDQYASVSRLAAAKEDRQKQSWAKLCTVQLGKGTLPPDAKGALQNLPLLAPTSAPLMRAWLKASKSKITADQLGVAVKSQQYTLVRDWIKSGTFDDRPELQVAFMEGMLGACQHLWSHSEAKSRSAVEAIEVIKERPDYPWPAMREAWKMLWTGQTQETSPDQFSVMQLRDSDGDVGEMLETVVRLAAAWTPKNGTISAYERSVLLHVARQRGEKITRALPEGITPADADSLFWDTLASTGEGAYTSNQTWKAAGAIITAGVVSKTLGLDRIPLEQAQERLTKMRSEIKSRGANSYTLANDQTILTAVEEKLMELSISQPTPGAARPRM